MIYKDFLFFITETDGRSKTEVNGVITAKAAPTPLPQAPLGWLDMVISWERDARKYGIIRGFTTKFEFPGVGGRILLHTYINENVERQLQLLIKRLTLDLTPTTYNFIYRYLYKGELDLTSLQINESTVAVNVMEGGVTKLLKANEGTVNEYPIDTDPEYINVIMDGIKITGVYNWVIAEYTTGSTGALPTQILVGEEQKAPGIAALNVTGGFTLSYSGIDADNTEYFLVVTEAPSGNTGRFTGTIRMSNPDPAFPANIILWVYNSIANTLTSIPLTTAQEASIVEIDTVVPVNEGDRFFLEIDEYRFESTLIFTIQNQKPATYVKALRPVDLYDRLCDNVITPAGLRASTLLAANNNALVFTSGDAVRGIPGAKIKTKLTDFFDAINVILNAGMGVEGKTLTLEAKSHYYDTTLTPIELGPVKDLKVSPAKDKLVNTIKIGYPPEEIEDVNGRYAFNNTTIFGLDFITRTPQELTLVCPYVTDPYIIELTRINFEGKLTTDGNQDNDVMVLSVELLQADGPYTISFVQAGNYIIVPNGMYFIPGQVVRITGTANSNDGDYTVNNIASILIAQLVGFTPAKAVTADEGPVAVNIEWVTGALYRLKRETYDNQGNPVDFGVPSPETIFNIEPFTPKRLLYTHGDEINSRAWGFDSEVIKFKSTDKNAALKTVLGSVTVDEDADVPVADLAPRLYLPVYFEFTAEVPVELIDILEATTNRFFSFTWNDITYTGFLIKAAYAPANNREQSFKLLAAPDNDLTPFINQI